jgi:Integrase core domain
VLFGERCARAGIEPSTGSKGDCFDNACSESFHATLEKELIYRQTWATRAEARTAIFEYIEGWYNPRLPLTRRVRGRPPRERAPDGRGGRLTQRQQWRRRQGADGRHRVSQSCRWPKRLACGNDVLIDNPPTVTEGPTCRRVAHKDLDNPRTRSRVQLPRGLPTFPQARLLLSALTYKVRRQDRVYGTGGGSKYRLALPVRPRHHDAFIIDESAERTADLDGHRSASNLDELDLREQAGAVA